MDFVMDYVDPINYKFEDDKDQFSSVNELIEEIKFECV